MIYTIAAMNNKKSQLQYILEGRLHHVGDTFEHCKLILKVCEGLTCRGCFFWIPEDQVCNYRTPSDHGYFEPCSPTIRPDDKSVIFVKVGEVKDNN